MFDNRRAVRTGVASGRRTEGFEVETDATGSATAPLIGVAAVARVADVIAIGMSEPTSSVGKVESTD